MYARGIAEGRREEGRSKQSLQHKIGLAMESKIVEYAICVLTAVDVLIVILEIGINAGWFCFGSEGEYQVRRLGGDLALTAGNTSAVTLAGHAHRTCETRTGHDTVHTFHLLHTTSIVLLSIMLAELVLKTFADPRELIKNKFHLLDIFVVSVSWTVDCFVKLDGTATIVELFVIMRLWRIARILHGLFEEYRVFHDETLLMQDQVNGLLELCSKNGVAVPEDLRAGEAEEFVLPFHTETFCNPGKMDGFRATEKRKQAREEQSADSPGDSSE